MNIPFSPSRANNNSFINNNSPSNTSPINNTTSNSLLSGIDFKVIDEMDPSLAEGHQLIFDKEVPIELRTMDQHESESELGTLEAIRVKVLISEGDSGEANVRVELTSEADLFFHYTHSIDNNSFQGLQQNQKLMLDFPNYPKMLNKLLNSCVKEPEGYLCIFVMERDGIGHLNFVQNMEYKFVELLSIEFNESPEHTVRQHVSFRYNSMRSRAAILNARLQEISSVLKVKNPSLLIQLSRQIGAQQQSSIGGSVGLGFTPSSLLNTSILTQPFNGNNSMSQKRK
ncbi:hypothetical protein ABK040_005284 [Willaertia magna]